MVQFDPVFVLGGTLTVENLTAQAASPPNSLVATITSAPDGGGVGNYAYGRQELPTEKKHMVVEARIRVDGKGATGPAALFTIGIDSSTGLSSVRLRLEGASLGLEEALAPLDGGPAYNGYTPPGDLPVGTWIPVAFDLDASTASLDVTVNGAKKSFLLDASWKSGTTKAVWVDSGILFAWASGWQISYDDLIVRLP